MSDITGGVTFLLATYIMRAAQRMLVLDSKPLDPDSVFISATEIDAYIEKFGTRPTIVVIPGPLSPDGPGVGRQEGGNLFRRQHYTLRVYQRFLLDRNGIDQQQIIQQTQGLLDFFEQIRYLFSLTHFANDDGNNNLLVEAMRWEGEGANESLGNGWVARSFNYSCLLADRLPDDTTIKRRDVDP